MTYKNYKVLITPLYYDNVYGDEIDVTSNIDISDLIAQSALSNIKKQFDNGDYDFGIFVFGDISLKCINSNGRFNDPSDYRTIFKYKRDLAKVKVVFVNNDLSENIIFEGLVNEDGTRVDIENNSVRLRVLSLDSILDQTAVIGGTVEAGVSFNDAIKQMLNTTQIKSVLNYDPNNINVDLDLVIDDGDFFTNLTVKEALDNILIASSSILYIDKDNNIIVTNRNESINKYNLYGDGNSLGLENIVSVKNYNSGTQRAFSSIKVNDTVITDQAYVEEYGFRQKSVDFNFINSIEKEEIIAQKLLDEFKVPRAECEITVLSESILGIELLDMVQVDYPLRFAPSGNQQNIVTVDTAVIGESEIPLAIGSVSINQNIKWKVTAIDFKPRNFTTTLRLRQAGKKYGEGHF